MEIRKIDGHDNYKNICLVIDDLSTDENCTNIEFQDDNNSQFITFESPKKGKIDSYRMNHTEVYKNFPADLS